MKKLLSIGCLLFFCIGTAGADGNGQYTERYKDIEYYDYDFQIKLDDRKAFVRWNAYPKDKGFKYYKLLYSTKYANPNYPDVSAKYVGTSIDDLSANLYLSGDKNHYIRLCTVTDEGYGVKGRYCSKTQKITLDERDIVQKEEKKVTYVKESKQKLSSELQTRIRTIIDNFIAKLKKSNYSDEKIVDTIDIILERLSAYEDNPKYSDIISYMRELLLIHRGKYEDNLDVLEDIFSDY